MTTTPTTSSSQAAAELEQLERWQKWRLILGKRARASLAASETTDDLGGHATAIDDALSAIYDPSDGSGKRGAGLGASAPRLARWLGDVRKYFPRDVVTVVQRDAVERKGLQQLLFEPELIGAIEPSIELAATLLSLNTAVLGPGGVRDREHSPA